LKNTIASLVEKFKQPQGSLTSLARDGDRGLFGIAFLVPFIDRNGRQKLHGGGSACLRGDL
jgi:hypothetical protein